MAPCRNAIHKSQKGYCVALKREDRVLERQQNQLIHKRRSNKPRYRHKCRRILTQGRKETRNPKVPREQLHRITKAMHELNLPFLAASERQVDISTELYVTPVSRFWFWLLSFGIMHRLLNRLRWSIDDISGAKEKYWRDTNSPDHQFPSMEHGSSRSPCWNQPPTRAVHLDILNSLIHFKQTCWRNQDLQIPSYWPVSYHFFYSWTKL